MMDQDKIWEALQNDEDLKNTGWSAGGRIEYMALRPERGQRVLNIGLGKGFLEELLINKNVDVHGLDPSATTIERIKEKFHLGDKVKVGYSQDIPFEDNYFDCVIMTEVLEHLTDDILAETLQEVKRVLKDDGVFFGSVPADEDLKAGLVVCPCCSEKFHRWGHHQSFSALRLKSVLENTFNSVLVRRIFFAAYNELNWKGKVSAFLRSLQAALNRKGSNQSFYFEARNR